MRGKPASKRKIDSELKYNSTVIAKFITHIMRRGKKSVAQRIVYDSFDIIQKKTQRDPLDVFDEAIKNTSPILEVKSRRIGGATYQIPVEVKGDRRLTLAMRWIIEAARNKKGKPISEKLAQELIEAAQSQGEAIKKKQDVYRMAEANRAFAHFAY